MYVAVGGVLVALFGLLRMYLGAVFVAALVSVVGVVTYLDAKDRTDSFGADYFGGSIGWGLFVVIGGGVAACPLLAESAFAREVPTEHWGGVPRTDYSYRQIARSSMLDRAGLPISTVGSRNAECGVNQVSCRSTRSVS